MLAVDNAGKPPPIPQFPTLKSTKEIPVVKLHSVRTHKSAEHLPCAAQLSPQTRRPSAPPLSK
jgi:hypothetical protein